MEKAKTHNAYRILLIMAALHFLAMFALMYSMVDNFSNVIPNLNQLYMAGVMTSPMIILELLLMGAMYHNKKRNILLIGISVLALIVFFILIRQQTAISDKEFLRSMIPHHAGAILMCNKAAIQDPEIQELCNNIIAGQQAEIDLMKSKLNEISR